MRRFYISIILLFASHGLSAASLQSRAVSELQGVPENSQQISYATVQPEVVQQDIQKRSPFVLEIAAGTLQDGVAPTRSQKAVQLEEGFVAQFGMGYDFKWESGYHLRPFGRLGFSNPELSLTTDSGFSEQVRVTIFDLQAGLLALKDVASWMQLGAIASVGQQNFKADTGVSSFKVSERVSYLDFGLQTNFPLGQNGLAVFGRAVWRDSLEDVDAVSMQSQRFALGAEYVF